MVKKKAKKTISKLSFADDDEEQEDQSSEVALGKRPVRNSEEGQDGDTEKAPAPVVKKSKFGKDPNIDTSFLPDREREEEERRVREELRQSWLSKQEEIKKETIQITYSYWDGSGHRKEVEVRPPAPVEINYYFISFYSLLHCARSLTSSILFNYCANSAKREIQSHSFWKSAGNNFSSCAVSALTT